MINRIFDDGGKSVTRGVVRGATENDWELAKNALLDWKSQGFLEMIADPEQGS
jgi:hypothetical protein